MPNSFAYLALLIWPLVVTVLFLRLPPARALIWSILGGYLLLPPASHAFIDPPAIPPLDKGSIPAIAAFLAALLLCGRRISLWPESWPARLLLLTFVLTPFGTVLTNPEPVAVAGSQPLTGLVLYDAIAIIVSQCFVLLTFALARSLITTAEEIRDLLVALMIGGLAYSLPMLVEIRLSPQINTWIYGFFQHSFDQMMRQGGFRPIVFLAHGLWVAFFAMTALLATLALLPGTEGAERRKLMIFSAYLFVILVLCKSIGSLIYALALAPVLYFAGQKWQLRLSLLMAILAISYPILRASDLFPAQAMVEFAAQYSADRAQSLEFRFDNEALLVDHAFRKPWFGWGGFDRNLLHDPFTGQVLTIADGQWVITIGMFGWSGFLAEFGLLCLPLLLLWRASEAGQVPLAPVVSGLAVIHGINLIDLLPNATLTPLSWLAAGALLGHAEAMRRPDFSQPQAARSAMLAPRPRTIL